MEWKGDANKLSCHTGTITCFLTSVAMYESLHKFINSSSYVYVISRGTPSAMDSPEEHPSS